MSQELGRVERPEAAQFRSERKVYLVPLLLGPARPPEEYTQLLERYWAGADEHVGRLEERLGGVKHIYAELTDRAGEDGLKIVDQISAGAAKFARARVERGATFEALEDAETLAETMDWERCLMMGLASRKVAEYASNAYRDASNRRYQMMARRLDETLKEGEAALAFLTEQHRLQFPESISVFYVAPPTLDEVHRWLRNYREQVNAAPPEDAGDQGSDDEASTEGEG